MQIRRRRECGKCGSRFNTFESPELKAPRIVKSDGAREAFSERKLRAGMLKALEKRPVETREVERAIRGLLREISGVEEAEIPSSLIGEWVMRELARLDQVAYIRFASVYERFDDIQAFTELI
jgi:transcriptional repressor NrdR